MVPHTRATLLDEAGHKVIWLDCIAENILTKKFIEIIKRGENPTLSPLKQKLPL